TRANRRAVFGSETSVHAGVAFRRSQSGSPPENEPRWRRRGGGCRPPAARLQFPPALRAVLRALHAHLTATRAPARIGARGGVPLVSVPPRLTAAPRRTRSPVNVSGSAAPASSSTSRATRAGCP